MPASPKKPKSKAKPKMKKTPSKAVPAKPDWMSGAKKKPKGK